MTEFKNFNFKDFCEFHACRDFAKQRDTISVRYRAETSSTVLLNDPKDLKKSTHTKSSNVIKINKIRIVAIFDLINRLLEVNYNAMYDLWNMDTEYRMHIEACRDQTKSNARLDSAFSPRNDQNGTDNFKHLSQRVEPEISEDISKDSLMMLQQASDRKMLTKKKSALVERKLEGQRSSIVTFADQ